jgi:hypothetical protein
MKIESTNASLMGGVLSVVLCETQYDGLKAYIKAVISYSNEKDDAIFVAEHGTKFPVHIAKQLIEEVGSPAEIEY